MICTFFPMFLSPTKLMAWLPWSSVQIYFICQIYHPVQIDSSIRRSMRNGVVLCEDTTVLWLESERASEREMRGVYTSASQKLGDSRWVPLHSCLNCGVPVGKQNAGAHQLLVQSSSLILINPLHFWFHLFLSPWDPSTPKPTNHAKLP